MNPDKVVDKLLEADQPAPEGDAAQSAADLIAKWDKAHQTYRGLRELHAKRDETFKKLGLSIEWARALAKVGHRPEEAMNSIPAQYAGSHEHPEGSVARLVWRAYAQKYPSAIIGAHLKSGADVLFKDPIPAKGMPDVPTYQEFKDARDKAREEWHR